MEPKRRRKFIRWFVAAVVLLLILCPVFYVHFKDWGESSYVSWVELPAGCEIEANRGREFFNYFWGEGVLGGGVLGEGVHNLARVRCPYDPETALEKFKAAYEKRDYSPGVDVRPARPDDLVIRSYLPESLKKGLYDARRQRPDGVFFMKLSEDWHGMDRLTFFAWPTTDGSVVEIIQETYQ